MKIQNFKSIISSMCLVFGLVVFGNVNEASAQFLFIQNNTACDIKFQAAESVGCSSCNIVPPSLVTAGGNFIAPSLCSNVWEGIKYQAASVFPFPGGGGVSYNPAGGGCGTDTNGSCSGLPITHTWFTFGLVTVHVFN